MKKMWVLAFACVLFAGCTNPAGPSNNNGGGGGTSTTVLTHEDYETSPYIGNWLAPDPGCQLQYQLGGAGAGSYCVSFYSLSQNATTSDHFRNTFSTTAAPSAPLTTSFMFNADNLNPAGSNNLKLHVQMTDNQVKWSFEIVGNGISYRFNNAALSSCQHCPAVASGWHKLTVKSTGTTTSSLAFDSFPSETSFTSVYSSGTIPDTFSPGIDILHITTGDCLDAPVGAKFLLDEFTVTTP